MTARDLLEECIPLEIY